MANGTTIPRDNAGKLALIRHLSANLPHYAETLEVSASTLAQLKAGADWFDLILKAQDLAQNYADALFAFKHMLRDRPKSAAADLPPRKNIPLAAQVSGFGKMENSRQVQSSLFLLHHIVDAMPEEVRGIPLHLVRAMIETAIARARKHGLSSDGQVMGFVGIMFEIAPNFDEEPTLRAILSDTRLAPAERWEALFADTSDLRAAWERAAHPDFYSHDAWTVSEPESKGGV